MSGADGSWRDGVHPSPCFRMRMSFYLTMSPFDWLCAIRKYLHKKSNVTTLITGGFLPASSLPIIWWRSICHFMLNEWAMFSVCAWCSLRVFCVCCLGFVQDNFLIYSDKRSLFQYSLAQKSTWQLPLRQPINTVQISLDTIQMKLYLTDFKRRLTRVNINGTDEEIISQALGTCRYLYYNVSLSGP